MFTRYLVLLILAVMCPEAVIAQAASPTGQLRGRIEDAVTRRPVAGASVSLIRGGQPEGSQTSDGEGHFAFTGLREGVYALEVDAPGHVKAVQPSVRIVFNKVASVDFILARADTTLEEVVVSAQSPAEDPRATPNTVALDREEIRRNPGAVRCSSSKSRPPISQAPR